ncbi:MAG: hypothetical protein AB2L20_12315 [Mangrovibacterium sp.]
MEEPLHDPRHVPPQPPKQPVEHPLKHDVSQLPLQETRQEFEQLPRHELIQPEEQLEHPEDLEVPVQFELQPAHPDDFEVPVQLELHPEHPDDFEVPVQFELHPEHPDDFEEYLHSPLQLLEHKLSQLDEDVGSSMSGSHSVIIKPVDITAMKGITLTTAFFKNSRLSILLLNSMMLNIHLYHLPLHWGHLCVPLQNSNYCFSESQ